MSQFQKIALAVIAVIVLILDGVVSYKLGHHYGYKAGYSAYHPSDTVVVIDTHTVYEPVEVVKWYEKDRPVYIPVHDTTTIHDSTYIVMPREVKQYRDSTYMAQVSGVDPALDWISVFQKTTTITQTVVEKVPYTERAYIFGEGSLSPVYRGIRVGAGYEKNLIGPLNGRLGLGYEYSNLGKDWFLEAGISIDLWNK